MSPELLMELSQLVQQLPPGQLQKMQGLMHNMMAGFDVRKEMEEFEKSLPPGFREKLTSLMGGMAMGGSSPPSSAETVSSSLEASSEMDLSEARLTILRAVAGGKMTPEQAEKLLFNS
jgi:hypothetical protein